MELGLSRISPFPAGEFASAEAKGLGMAEWHPAPLCQPGLRGAEWLHGFGRMMSGV